MKAAFHSERLAARTPVAFGLATEDVRADARRRVRSRTGKFRDSITLTPVEDNGAGRYRREVGSPLSSAVAKEKGAYIERKRAPWLVFNAGGGVRRVAAVRLPARPVVTPAGRLFREFMTARLRELAGR